MFSSKFEGSEETRNADGITFVHRGNRFTVYNEARKFYQHESKGKIDVVIDGINSVPFFTPLYVKERKVALVFQLTQTTFLTSLPPVIGLAGLVMEPLVHSIVYSKLPSIVLSKSVRDQITSFGYQESKIFVAEPGTDHLVGRTEIEKTVQPTVLYLNRVVPYKNVHHLVRAFQIVRNKVPSAKLIIAGCRGGAYERKVRALAARLGLNGSVEFLEFTQGARKTQLLSSAWVHVLPSSLEGWGISVAEAASVGTPSVAYESLGLKDSVRHGETGFLVSRGDWRMLAKAIVAILTQEDVRDKFSSNAVRWASGLTWDRTSHLAYEALCA